MKYITKDHYLLRILDTGFRTPQRTQGIQSQRLDDNEAKYRHCCMIFGENVDVNQKAVRKRVKGRMNAKIKKKYW